MKKIIYPISILLIIFLMSSGMVFKGETIDIKAYNKNSEPEAELSKHAEFDIEVYRYQSDSIFMYDVYFYRISNNKLRYYKATNSSKEYYSLATYKWMSDTLVDIRLHNGNSQNELKFKVFGRGNSTGVQMHYSDKNR